VTTIGIIGAGSIGQAIAGQMSKAGCAVIISNSRGPDSLTRVARELGATVKAGTVAQAAAAEMVVLAVPWNHLPRAVAGLPPFDGRIVLDATNPIYPPDFKPVDLGERTSSEIVADLVPGARLVKAFNTLTPEVLGSDPREAGGRRVLFYSGDDTQAKKQVARLLYDMGFAGVDLGSLATGGPLQQFPGGPLPTLNLIRLS
jgi:8-hydroxy-5-deazaflavin:NADPH oxidoreductase